MRETLKEMVCESGEIAQSVQCLSHMHKDLVPNIIVKKLNMMAHTMLELRMQRQEDPKCSLASESGQICEFQIH